MCSSDLEIEKLKDYLYLLDKISMERIRDEFNKIILSKDIENALSILEKSGVLQRSASSGPECPALYH